MTGVPKTNGTVKNSKDEQKTLLQQQLAELIKVGVGGKFQNTEDYTKKITDELNHIETM